jgi:uncharacterized damage-inducible protein DinB
MNDGLIDSFRHNAWATREVLAACQGLSPEQLDSTVTGTYGSIFATLRHLVSSESGYYRRLSGEEPEWFARERETDDVTLADLVTFNDDLEQRWLRFLSTPFDAERTFSIGWENEEPYDVPAGVVLVQALHHGNEHRTQVNTTLTAIGEKAPEIGVWEWSEASGRAKPGAL